MHHVRADHLRDPARARPHVPRVTYYFLRFHNEMNIKLFINLVKYGMEISFLDFLIEKVNHYCVCFLKTPFVTSHFLRRRFEIH